MVRSLGAKTQKTSILRRPIEGLVAETDNVVINGTLAGVYYDVPPQ